MVNSIDETLMRVFSVCVMNYIIEDKKNEPAQEIFLDIVIGKAIPRKLSLCQYVIASGQMKCFQADSQCGEYDHFLSPDLALLGSLASVDPGFSETTTATSLVPLMQDPMSAGLDVGPQVAAWLANFGAPNTFYTGVPIVVRGVPIATLCGFFQGDVAELSAEEAQVHTCLRATTT